MKLKDYAQKINELAQKAPDAEVIYTIDDEENAFHSVYFDPTLGVLEAGEFDPSEIDVTHCCIN